ncbi:hypothetical protein V1478_006085 [Vespula squamosa]|uniref:Uncharacterized protein n=1 Tax=Vespula squamosa TaxID=30214 RepID=A0ABD2B6W3_VESSQ
MEARRCTPAENHFKPLHVRVYIAISFANPTVGSNCGRARRKYVVAHHAQYDLHAVRMSSERRDKLSGGL